MKRSKIVLFVTILCLAVLCGMLFGCVRKTHKLDLEQVEKITLYCGEVGLEYVEHRTDGVDLDTEDMEKFVNMFNDATYGGKDVGYGTTSQWGCVLFFRDGSKLRVQEYGNHNFIVTPGLGDASFYFVNSIKLDALVTDLVTKHF